MGFRDMCPRPARSWCEGSSIRPLTPWSLPATRRAARVGAAATAAAAGGAMVAGAPLRRVGAPTPRLLRSPPLAKVQSHSHHLLRQVLFAYLAVPPCLVELVVIAILHHSLLHCVVHNPCHPIPRLSVGKFELGVIPGSRRRRPEYSEKEIFRGNHDVKFSQKGAALLADIDKSPSLAPRRAAPPEAKKILPSSAL